MKYKLMHAVYTNIFKPIAFQIDAEHVHNRITKVGELLENYPNFLENIFAFKSKKLKKKVAGLDFDNPIGLSAGFDYDGHMAKTMKHVGFGFNTVGTVTALPYGGNKGVKLARLPKSKSLLVNKGFKSEGATKVAERLDKKNLKNHIVGISVGSSNIPEINTIEKAIKDYLFTFNVFKKKNYIKYFELNISCPNTSMKESFTHPKNFKKLTNEVTKLKIKQPIFVKMPNEIELEKSDELVRIALKSGINGFVFSNLVKNRQSIFFDKKEIEKFKNYKGNFSGKPCFLNSNKLISHSRKIFGNKIVIVGTGGIFNADDALLKLESGADLVQLITGMIFEGPQLIGEICKDLSEKI